MAFQLAIPEFTAEQEQVEYDLFVRRPDWELTNVYKALNMMRLLNTPEQEARLAAVRRIQRERRTAVRNRKGKRS